MHIIKRGEVNGEYGRISGEEEGNADYGGMVQHSQQHVVPSIKGFEWGLGTRGLRIAAAFWAGIWGLLLVIFFLILS